MFELRTTRICWFHAGKKEESKDFFQRSSRRTDVISQSYSHARSFTMVLWRYTWYLSNNNVRSHVDRNSVAIWNCVRKKLKVMWYKQIWSKMKQRAREFLFLLIIILLFRYHFSLLWSASSYTVRNCCLLLLAVMMLERERTKEGKSISCSPINGCREKENRKQIKQTNKMFYMYVRCADSFYPATFSSDMAFFYTRNIFKHTF